MRTITAKDKFKQFPLLTLTKVFLALTVILSPTYIVRHKICCFPLIGEYPTTLLEILIFTTFGLYLVEKIRLRNFRFQTPKPDFLLAIGLVLLAAVLSVIVSPDKGGGLGILKAYFVEPIVVFFILIEVVRDKKDWWLVFNSLLLSGFWLAILAILQVVTGKFVFSPYEASQGRAHAVYNTANAVGLFLGPLLAFSFGFFLEALLKKLKTQRSKLKTTAQNSKLIIYGVTTFVFVLAILFSKSRGAFVGVFSVFTFLTINFLISLYPNLRLSRIIRRTGLQLVVIGVGLFLGFSSWLFINISQFTPKVENPWLRPAGTGTVRLCVWEGTKNLLRDKPIFGAGLSGFKEIYSQKYITCDAEPLEYPHNIILNFWTETSLLGLIGFLLVVFFYFRNLALSKNEALKFSFAAALLYWLVHGLVDVPYFKNDLSVEFWVLVGLLLKVSSAFNP